MINYTLATFMDWLTENLQAFGPGKGLFCTTHIVLMVLLGIWGIAFIFLAKKYPKFAAKFGAILAITMSTLRIIRMIIQVASGKYTFVEALPWHLCHIMCFALTIIYFIKSTRFSLPVLFLSVLGGVMTFIFGDYYYTNVLTFYMIESIILHFCLVAVVICYIASKKPKYNWVSVLEVPIFLAVLCGWASIGNAIFPERNFMYLKQNGLPFNLFGTAHFMWTYLIVAIIVVSVVFGVYFLVRYLKKMHNSKQKNINNIEK